MVAPLGDLEEVVEAELAGALDGERVGAPEGIAVVFNQPEVVLLAKFQDGGEVERIAERVGHHDRLGLARREGGFKL